MDVITGKILKLNNWPDGKIIGLAKDIGNKLIEGGMEREYHISSYGEWSTERLAAPPPDAGDANPPDR